MGKFRNNDFPRHLTSTHRWCLQPRHLGQACHDPPNPNYPARAAPDERVHCHRSHVPRPCRIPLGAHHHGVSNLIHSPYLFVSRNKNKLPIVKKKNPLWKKKKKKKKKKS